MTNWEKWDIQFLQKNKHSAMANHSVNSMGKHVHVHKLPSG